MAIETSELQNPFEKVEYLDADRPANLTDSIKSLWINRDLVLALIQRDFTGRYKGSLLGAMWPLLNPLGHMFLYTFLFGIILQVRFGDSGGMSNFVLYMMTGYLPYLAMSEAISNATTKILEEPNLVKKVVFPLEIIPLVVAISGFLNSGISIFLVIGLAAFYLHCVHITVLLLPIVIIPHFVFTLGICWFISSFGVFVQDCKHFMALVLSGWMYASPIVYPVDKLPESLQWIVWVNPLAGIIQDYRRLIIEGTLPHLVPYCTYSLIAIIVCAFGFIFFHKTKDTFADVM